MLDESNSEERISCPGAKNRRINNNTPLLQQMLTLHFYNNRVTD